MRLAAATLRIERGRTVVQGADDLQTPVAVTRSPPVVRPFLKWTGGKQWLAAIAQALIPEDFDGRYFEPFLGGGSVFFALGVRRAVLGDANAELIAAFEGVQKSPDRVIDLLRSYPHDREFYERIRSSRP